VTTPVDDELEETREARRLLLADLESPAWMTLPALTRRLLEKRDELRKVLAKVQLNLAHTEALLEERERELREMRLLRDASIHVAFTEQETLYQYPPEPGTEEFIATWRELHPALAPSAPEETR
jgi:hypothetical protein